MSTDPTAAAMNSDTLDRPSAIALTPVAPSSMGPLPSRGSGADHNPLRIGASKPAPRAEYLTSTTHPRRRNHLKKAVRNALVAGATASLAIGATALPASAAKPDWANKSDASIVETAVALSGTPFEFDSNGDDFDILVGAVVATEYNMSTLNGMDDYTVFAPTDAAFVALADVLDNGMSDGSISTEDAAFAAVAGLGLPTVVAVLDYHVTDGVRNSKSVTQAKQVTMLDGNTISARGGFVDAIGSDAGFVATDIRVADGMIHVVDTVLLPF